MVLKKSDVPPISEIDVDAMVARYAHERERRLRSGGAKDYVAPKGGKLPDYAVDPQHDPVPREPIERPPPGRASATDPAASSRAAASATDLVKLEFERRTRRLPEGRQGPASPVRPVFGP